VRPKPPQFFGLDLNCAIYHCVKKLQTKQPFAEDAKGKWESDLIESVVKYIKQIHTIVNPTDVLYIAVDGVAPMAKMKQQRMRRFKSAVLAEEEGRIRAEAKNVPYVEKPRWDTNAITPGTKFMEKLTIALRAYAKTNKKIVTSPADEPGEGEQKIMNYLRTSPYKDATIYGLDADLIILSLYAMANQGIQIDLFREEVEINGGVKSDEDGKESFLYVNTEILSESLYSQYSKPNQTKTEFLKDFVALMSILGNDFVPHGMSLKIRDEGIEKLLSIYKEDLSIPLLQNGTYDRSALLALFRILEEEEAKWILKGIKAKLQARFFCHSRDAADIAISKMNDLPVTWAAERCMVDTEKNREGKTQFVLKKNWKAMYDKESLWDVEPEKAAKRYLEALHWTFAYYKGEKIDTYWYYPWHLPPRMETIVKELESSRPIVVPNQERPLVQPLEQLAMVLPLSSFHLLPPEYKELERLHPHAWPTKWDTYSFGRRFLWECEPLIPLIKPDQMKQWMESLFD